MSRLALALLFLCAACESKPTKSDLTSGSSIAPSGKATRGEANTSGVMIETQVAYSPRKAHDLEREVLLNHEVQGCLRPALRSGGESFTVGLQGHINEAGDIDKVQTQTADAILSQCLGTGLRQLKLGRGPKGLFKMQILRSQSAGKKSKGVLIDLNDVKKFE